MKIFTVILCGWLLALAPLFATQPAPCAPAAALRTCCACGGKMACCSVQSDASVPVKANLVRTASLNEIFLPPQIISLPAPLASSYTPGPGLAVISIPVSLPIYARDCARLI